MKYAHQLRLISRYFTGIGLLFSLIASSPLYGQEKSNSKYHQADRLIKQNLFANEIEINILAEYLTPEQRITLYRQNKKEPWLMAALNILLGFGIGSYVGGDIGTGIAGTLLDSLSLAGMFTVLFFPMPLSMYQTFEIVWAIGLTSFLSRCIQLVFPFAHTTIYNNKLKAALDVPRQVAWLVAPTIERDPLHDDGRLGVTAGVAFRF